MPAVQETVEQVRRIDVDQYKYGFVTDIESEKAPKGLSDDTIRFISAKKGEPEWLLEWRLKSYRHWLTMHEPRWANVKFAPIDYQAISYYAAPKKGSPKRPEDIDPELLKTYEKLGIPLRERELLAGVAVDAVFDSVSVATTFKEKLRELGIIFCSFSEAVREHPLGLVLLGRDEADGVVVEPLGGSLGFDIGDESVLVLINVDAADLLDGLLNGRHFPLHCGFKDRGSDCRLWSYGVDRTVLPSSDAASGGDAASFLK